MIGNTVIIRKNGLFYVVLNEDAYIINYLFGYKIVNGKCGFPNHSLDKVLNVLDEKKINYVLVTQGERKKDFKELNMYQYYLNKSKSKLLLNGLINEIDRKMELLSEEKLNKLLEYINRLIEEE